jgi:hypothetical protein
VQADLRVPCDETSYEMYLAVAIAVTSVFVVGFPVMYGLRFWRNRRYIMEGAAWARGSFGGAIQGTPAPPVRCVPCVRRIIPAFEGSHTHFSMYSCACILQGVVVSAAKLICTDRRVRRGGVLVGR